jgi:copper(I)-binding protein
MSTMSKTVGRLACVVALLLLAGALFSGAMAEAQVRLARVSGAWVRLAAIPGRPAAGYFTITGGSTGDKLVSVSSPAASRIELHDSMMANGMMSMATETNVAVPARATLAFAPRGRHAMLYDLHAVGGKVPLTLHFASGAAVTIEAATRAAGDAAP